MLMLKEARLINPGTRTDEVCDILIAERKIIKIGQKMELDARLIARGGYRWRAVDRAEALGDALYSKAVDWKFRPADEPVCGIAAARSAWTDALDEVFRADGARDALARRSVYNAARWIVRRRTLGEFRTFGLDPVARVLAVMREAVEEGKPFSPGLKKDWIQFN